MSDSEQLYQELSRCYRGTSLQLQLTRHWDGMLYESSSHKNQLSVTMNQLVQEQQTYQNRQNQLDNAIKLLERTARMSVDMIMETALFQKQGISNLTLR